MGSNPVVVNVTRERFFRKVRALFIAHAKRNSVPTTKDLKKFLVPIGVENTATPGNFGEGMIFKYVFISSNGEMLMVKYHAADMKARKKYPGSNAGNGWTCQILVGRGEFFTFDYSTAMAGTSTIFGQNAAHIPVICCLDKSEKGGLCQTSLFFLVLKRKV